MLLWSLSASAVLGSMGLIWGLLAGADVIVFDGVYTLASIALSAGSLLASRAASAEPTRQFPYGLSAAVPLAVVVQGAALAATLLYALIGAVQTLIGGGSDTTQVALLAYGAVSGLLCCLVVWLLGRLGVGTDLTVAEVVGWRAGAVLSLVVAVGGGAGLVMERAGLDAAADYVDPVLVLVAVAVVSPMPARLVRDGMFELLEGTPEPEVLTDLHGIVDDVRQEFGLPAPTVRATKLGRRLYVDVVFVVPHGDWDVDAEDEVRRSAVGRLRRMPFDVWANVELTADVELVP
ncbi:Predicted Co/Zn/Cd cation transporter, cation efflux family [Krasilnikoviella flava]|uniref:Predicted Co/Zn/Cd cation transporter, cation efflux family n=1 Tax=Krasilnikoviella flava TaxID=526729 RepID=A0A1T5K7Q2_9MICO|nr:Predicted Co/Zn/Cd cation transporter, cation efflux family [Krasilnikoviella flava]